MITAKNPQFAPDQKVINRIIVLRNENIMLDIHLAEIYEVETRALKQAVRRNLDLFPDDFMFVLTEGELEEVVSQNVIPSKQHFGGSFPYAFTETGIASYLVFLKVKEPGK